MEEWIDDELTDKLQILASEEKTIEMKTKQCYLFCPQRRAFWRGNAHGYTARIENAGKFSASTVEGWTYEIATPQNIDRLLVHSKSFAVGTTDHGIIEQLQRMTPDVPGEVFV